MIPFTDNFDCASVPKVKLVSLAEAVELLFQNCLSGFLSSVLLSRVGVEL
jgi:hypothetical protein